MAAALGAELPVEAAKASMVLDIGGGTTDVAVISLGGIVQARSIRVGGDEIDEAIVAFVKNEYSLLLGSAAARTSRSRSDRRFRCVKNAPCGCAGATW